MVDPGDVVVHDRGQPGWQREVHDIVAEAMPAQRLLVGETFNAAGQWSSFPPHKHDGGDGEPALEEVYYYRFDRPDGFGFQGLYDATTSAPDAPCSCSATVRSSASRAAITRYVRHRVIASITSGRSSAAPGTPRALALYEDPAHRWLHDELTLLLQRPPRVGRLRRVG